MCQRPIGAVRLSSQYFFSYEEKTLVKPPNCGKVIEKKKGVYSHAQIHRHLVS